MDMKQIGQFLAQLRKEHSLTQEALGDILGVSNKTISRWENGNYLPPVEMLQLLSKQYDISINEILSGQKLTDAEYKQKAEDNLKSTLSESTFSLEEKKAYYKRKWIGEHKAAYLILTGISVIVLIAGILCMHILIPIALIAAAGLYLLAYNRMMSYIENHAFDGKG